MRLFVYGTLKRGGSAEHLLAGARWLGAASTGPGYRLIDFGAFPGLLRRPAIGEPVLGELWEVGPELLAELDRYEGVPGLFKRGEVGLADGSVALAYFYARPVPANAREGTEWPF